MVWAFAPENRWCGYADTSLDVRWHAVVCCGCVQEFTRNVRREVAKLKLLLQQYAILSTQVSVCVERHALCCCAMPCYAVLCFAVRLGSKQGAKVALAPLFPASIVGTRSFCSCGVVVVHVTE